MNKSRARYVLLAWFAIVINATMTWAALAQTPQTATQPTNKNAATSMRRTADGKPDLSGYWSNLAPGMARPAINTGPVTLPKEGSKDWTTPNAYRNGDLSNLTNDNVPLRRVSDNLPLYKPELWEQVLDYDLNGNIQDPYNSCFPAGLPRIGTPVRIVQSPTDLIFFYRVMFQVNQFRMIPMGERDHPVDRDGLWLGDPIAHWEGDTLVVVTEGFNDQTWLGAEGYFHSYELKVTERFKPDGDKLIYDVTAEDPDVLQRPWVLNTRTLYRVTASAEARLPEAPPCSDQDAQHLVGKQREM